MECVADKILNQVKAFRSHSYKIMAYEAKNCLLWAGGTVWAGARGGHPLGPLHLPHQDPLHPLILLIMDQGEQWLHFSLRHSVKTILCSQKFLKAKDCTLLRMAKKWIKLVNHHVMMPPMKTSDQCNNLSDKSLFVASRPDTDFQT